jgi:hypothetical protein
MTLHDARIERFGQWWARSRRAGHAFAEVAHLHGNKPEGIWQREIMRAYLWTVIGVIALVAGIFIHKAAFALLLVYPLQIARMALRDNGGNKENWIYAALIMLQKPWEAAGAMQYWVGRLARSEKSIIDYKR